MRTETERSKNVDLVEQSFENIMQAIDIETNDARVTKGERLQIYFDVLDEIMSLN